MLTTAPKSTTQAIMDIAANAFNVKSTSEDAVTLTVTEFINGVYIQTGTPGTSIKTSPTAAAIVAAIIGCAIGSKFEFIVDNGGDAALTLAAGDGVTISGTATITEAKTRMFVGVVTAVTVPAVRVISMAQLA